MSIGATMEQEPVNKEEELREITEKFDQARKNFIEADEPDERAKLLETMQSLFDEMVNYYKEIYNIHEKPEK